MAQHTKITDPKLDEATRALKLTRPLALILPAGKARKLRRLLKTIDERRAKRAA